VSTDASTAARSYEGADRPRVAAVVVTYNRKVLLRQCLTALQAQTHSPAEIIVVDNASTDGTAQMVETAFPDITLRVLDENWGGAGGFHEGMRLAAGQDVDWIWVMDDDAEPKRDALERLFRPRLHERESTVALASQKVGTDNLRQSTHAGDYDPICMRKTPVTLEGPEIEEVQFSSFVGLMVQTETVKRIGLPEAGYFIWGDDAEYSLRLGQVGRLFLVRSSRIVHHDAFATERKTAATLLSQAWRDRPVDQYWRNYYALRNRLLIVNKFADNAAYRYLGYLMGALRMIRSAAAVLAFDNHKWFRLKVLLKGLRHGIKEYSEKYYDPDNFKDMQQFL